jgi:hypothetical protein
MRSFARATYEDGSKFDKSAVPRVQPVIDQIAVDADGRVWIRRTDTPESAPGFDVFDEAGRAVMTVSTTQRWQRIPIVRNGFAYGVVLDADDVPHIVKAQLRPR